MEYTAGEPGQQPKPEVNGAGRTRFTPEVMHAAATLYYLKEATQAQVAQQLGISRATVSRVLSEARRTGIVRIEVVDPATRSASGLEEELRDALGLNRVFAATGFHPSLVGAALAARLGEALTEVGLKAGDVLLVSSGRTVWEVSQEALPSIPGVVVTPTVGGQDEPEAWYQTNEITRMFADQLDGRPVFLYAPAQPGAELHGLLVQDPGTRRVLDLWNRAKVAVLGVGAPPLTRESMPGYVPREAPWLGTAAGDICTRFFDEDGRPLPYPEVEYLIATSFETLNAIPHTIAVAVGATKVPSIVAGARAGWFNTLVTDEETAAHVLDSLATGRHP
ncbi:sugar-binding domain-containing protein [Promicromonospora sp. NPDC023987]|uniref:sugar-binding transcriptional regulator n=1 Tax=Promicromonospora sp. NPDC023987 TaxID=3155360 RepID=UPI003406CB73